MAGLIFGGLVAMASAWYGRKEQSSWDEVLLFFGAIVGAATIGIGVWAWNLGEYEISTSSVLVLLGLSLFLRAIKGIKLAALIALIAGAAVGYGLYWADKAYSLDFLTNEIILMVASVVLMIVYLTFRFAEDLLDLGGVLLGFRPIQFLMGLVSLGEAALLLAGYSLWYFLA